MKIQIKDFQPFSLVELDVHGLTVIVGPSNIGKSALIRAISSALFGRGGDDFIRLGTKHSQVQILDAPSVTTFRDKINVTWTKGGGLNKFEVNGITYDKVSTSVPIPLQEAGYKDVKVNDEYIRPQVSGQFFDNLFLLDRPGSFANDVISQATRLSVLLKADKLCSTDLKRQSSLLKVREGDLVKATADLEDLKGVPEFRAKVYRIRDSARQVIVLSRRVEDARFLSSKLASLKELSSSALPPSVKLDAALLDKVSEVSELRQRWASLLELPSLPLPRKIDFSKLEEALAMWTELSNLRSLYSKYSKKQLHSSVAVKSADVDLMEAQSELDEALLSMKICPVCDRPMGDQVGS